MDLDTLFLYLSNAVITLNTKNANQVFQNMAYKLIEWDDIPRSELRRVFNTHGLIFEELCACCNEPLPDYEGDEEEPRCEACLENREPLEIQEAE